MELVIEGSVKRFKLFKFCLRGCINIYMLSALKHVADVAKTWGKFSPRHQTRPEKSKVALLKVRNNKTFKYIFLQNSWFFIIKVCTVFGIPIYVCLTLNQLFWAFNKKLFVYKIPILSGKCFFFAKLQSYFCKLFYLHLNIITYFFRICFFKKSKFLKIIIAF